MSPNPNKSSPNDNSASGSGKKLKKGESPVQTVGPDGQLISILPKGYLEITVSSVMAGVKQARVVVAYDCLVRDLKAAICEQCEVFPDKQLLLYKGVELKDDEATIRSYGITEDCAITMNVRMNTGVARRPGSAAEVIFFVPTAMPQGNVASLRKVIRSMSNAKPRPKKAEKKQAQQAQIWTPEKQLEHELTRNRMKTLMKGRKRKSILSSTPCDSRDGGSVLGSNVQSPIHTPPEYAHMPAVSGEGGGQPVAMPEVTERELKLFFETAESKEELAMKKSHLYLPPQNESELDALKKKIEEINKSRCKRCRKRLQLSEQSMMCACKYAFCFQHRKPEDHFCSIDYKHAGRGRLQKENPKIGEGGARKAKI